MLELFRRIAAAECQVRLIEVVLVKPHAAYVYQAIGDVLDCGIIIRPIHRYLGKPRPRHKLPIVGVLEIQALDQLAHVQLFCADLTVNAVREAGE